MTEDEKIQWNNLKDEIIQDGMNVGTFNSMDWNILNAETIKFAYVIIKTQYTDVSETTQLDWSFNADGYMELVQNDDGVVLYKEKQIEYKSNIDNSMIKMTVMT